MPILPSDGRYDKLSGPMNCSKAVQPVLNAV